jgi:Fur family ferric uptake transcriptional regulator
LTTLQTCATVPAEIDTHLGANMVLTEKNILTALKARGYKLTPQRKVVLNVIVSSHDHLSAAEIYERAHRLNPRIGLATVYRTLDILLDMGRVCQIHSRGSSPVYMATRAEEHHHHLVCTECGTVVHFAECDLEDLELRMSLLTGFDIRGHFLQLSGLCGDCQPHDKDSEDHS